MVETQMLVPPWSLVSRGNCGVRRFVNKWELWRERESVEPETMVLNMFLSIVSVPFHVYNKKSL